MLLVLFFFKFFKNKKRGSKSPDIWPNNHVRSSCNETVSEIKDVLFIYNVVF